MTRLRLCFVVVLLGTPAVALAQPDPFDRYDSSIAGEAVPSVDVFYDQLSPYGVWIDEPRIGRVFVPDRASFVPYTNGHWQYTNVGFVWISPDPFEWATAHYGRWLYSQRLARWAWLPDTVWGPSWVEWRQYGDYFGWAPLPPAFAIGVGYAPPIDAWHYCPASRVLDANVARYYAPRQRVVQWHRWSRPIQHYARIGDARIDVGPPPMVLRARHLDLRRNVLDPRASGRWSREESRAAVRRAQDRRPMFEESNRRRIENNAPLRERLQPRPQVQRPAAQPPRRPDRR